MTSDRKLRNIREILRNETYDITSGLYQRLEIALNKLSADVLSDLATVIEQKIRETKENTRSVQ